MPYLRSSVVLAKREATHEASYRAQKSSEITVLKVKWVVNCTFDVRPQRELRIEMASMMESHDVDNRLVCACMSLALRGRMGSRATLVDSAAF